MEFTYENDAGEEVEVDLPTREMSCPTCFGKGRHSLALGAITEEDRERDWSPDEWESYTGGGYDQLCDTCDGNGRVEVVDEKQLEPDVLARWHHHCEDEADYRALCAAERRFGC
jgi:hypothetical protein